MNGLPLPRTGVAFIRQFWEFIARAGGVPKPPLRYGDAASAGVFLPLGVGLPVEKAVVWRVLCGVKDELRRLDCIPGSERVLPIVSLLSLLEAGLPLAPTWLSEGEQLDASKVHSPRAGVDDQR